MTSETSLSDSLSKQYVDLLDERLGGKALSCSDEWFAAASNLVKPGRGIFKQGHFVDTGQWMDGWESRRGFGRNSNTDQPHEYDWCILKLGAPGRVYGFDIDTNHFRGNAPEFVSVEAANLKDSELVWQTVLNKVTVNANSQNPFCINDLGETFTHVRLNIFPDGGVARFRVYGKPSFQRQDFVDGELIDLASVLNGGQGVSCSDEFYSSPTNLLMPKHGINMGDGWETKRRRDNANDWAIIKLGLTGNIRKVVLDTAHFKGNFPDRFKLEAVLIDADTNSEQADYDAAAWQEVIPETQLLADQNHIFIDQIKVDADQRFSHVRLSIFPDGGVSRLRILGFPDWSVL